jgi:adenine-specific DNA-methyltransferase
MTYNINRTELVWPGKYDEKGNLVLPEPSNLPFQVVERINETRATRTRKESEGDTLFDYWDMDSDAINSGEEFSNKLVWGDNLLVISSLLQSFMDKLDMIYIDPPFEVGYDFSMEIEVGDIEINKSPSMIEVAAYNDTWGQGTNSYLSMIYGRLVLMRNLLKDTGVIFIHIDWRLSSQIRLISDEIFGSENFRSEIIWKKTNSPKSQSAGLGNQYDSILVFSKSEKAKFKKAYKPFDEKSLKPYSYEDSKGKFRLIELEAQGVQRTPNRKQFEFKGRKAPWLYNLNQLNEWDSTGYIYESQNGRFSKKQYLNEVPGVLISDLWVDDGVSPLQGSGKEVSGYPTQKPESLLSRIIELSTEPGDLVGDFFCGSGTTLVSAEKLKRKWIGSDLGRFAIHTTRKRLLEIQGCTPFEILNLGKYERQLWSRNSFGTETERDDRENYFAYLTFVLKLYGAVVFKSGSSLHGERSGAFVHVGSVSSPITIDEIRSAINECVAVGGKRLDVLGWEWEMGLIEIVLPESRSKGIELHALQIPNEIMNEVSIDKDQVTFFELSYLEVKIEKTRNGFLCNLMDFVIPNPELIPDEVRERIKNWSDFIDYWAVDWNFQNDTFMPTWMDFRTRQNRKLDLQTSEYEFEAKGTYKVMVKVVDIFGNDSTSILDLEVN